MGGDKYFDNCLVTIHPINSKIPAPQYQPIDREKRNGKIVEDYSADRAA